MTGHLDVKKTLMKFKGGRGSVQVEIQFYGDHVNIPDIKSDLTSSVIKLKRKNHTSLGIQLVQRTFPKMANIIVGYCQYTTSNNVQEESVDW